MEYLISAKNLNVSFPGNHILHEVDIHLKKGEFLVLAGESGSGKTLLCRSLIGLPPTGASVTYSHLKCPPGDKMSFILQNAGTALDPAMPIGKQITEIKSSYPLSPAELLSEVEIDNPKLRIRQYPGELSGGMRQRVAVAIAAAMQPEVIFADEPTTALDSQLKIKITELIAKTCKDKNTGIIFVTHDILSVSAYADRILIMKNGRIIEQGDASDIINRPAESYTKNLLRSSVSAVTSISVPSQTKLGPAAPVLNLSKGFCYSGSSTDIGSSKALNCSEVLNNTEILDNTGISEPIVQVINLHKIFPLKGKTVNTVLKNVNLNIYPGKIIGLCGPSGIGKSTLARCISGLEKPSGGHCIIKKGTNIQMIFQDSFSALNPRMKIADIIGEPILIKQKTRASRETIAKYMKFVDLSSDYMNRKPGELSGGERQRVAIARVLAAKPDLIIADEPVSSLDAATCAEIIKLLVKLKDEHNPAIIFISHDMNILSSISDEIIDLSVK